MYKHSYMLLKATRDAFHEAGLQGHAIPPEEIGYYAGMGMVDYTVDDLLPAVLQSLNEQGELDYDRFYSDAFRSIHPLWPLSMLNNINFCQVAIDLGIKGDNTTFCPHADSALHSVIEGYHAVRDGTARAALVGGVSETVSAMSLARAEWFNLLNGVNGVCSPFGKERAGSVLGEGCGIVTLELLSSALERGVACLAALTGYGTSCERSPDSNTATAGAIMLSMKEALTMANLSPADIDLIIAHGEGTVEGDGREITAINTVFDSCPDRPAVYSSKGALGHLLAGAPAVDMVLGIYMLRSGIIPATYCSPPFDNSIAFSIVSEGPLKSGPRRILINSRSYEGQCASVILEAVDQ
jgi:3-oxoacyl-[acyl-carrier-protein] synthase II